MILLWIIALPLLGGALAWYAGRRSAEASRWIAGSALLIDLVISVVIWYQSFQVSAAERGGRWLIEYARPWLPQFGIGFHLAVDGFSLLLVVLTLFLGLLSVICSWREIQMRAGLFHMHLLWTLAGVLGVFLALDLFLFYFFWELMIVPMYFLIAIWGHENRSYASVKFFIFTQLGGLLMLLSILALYFVHGRSSGTYTFDYLKLLGTSMPLSTSLWLMLGFFIAFAVKLPAIPFHTWLPDAHTEAPTAGSVVLAGLLLKTGAYGMIRFMVPLFPEAVAWSAPAGMALGVTGVIYGASLAFAQKDLKRLVAYTSVSHMGFVLLGVFAWNEIALQGTVMQMITHALSTGGLFIVAGLIQERINTRDMDRMGGLWSSVPRLGGVTMVFAMASLGLPGMGNFIAEFLVLAGAFQRNIVMASLASAGLVAATVYSLIMMQKVFFGPPKENARLADVSLRELFMTSSLVAALLFLGLYPKPVLETAGQAIRDIAIRPGISAFNNTPTPKTLKQTSGTTNAEAGLREISRDRGRP